MSMGRGWSEIRDPSCRRCRDAGFARCQIESIEVRLDTNVPIAGFIAVAKKS